MNNYDEDLKANPFYKALLEHEADLENASKKDWIICIPRSGTTQPPITKTDIYSHILVPSSTRNCFTTLNNLVITINNNKLEIEDRVDYFSAIRILFNETFYHKQMRYKVYCIEFPLSRHFTQANPINHIVNLRDCIDFLWIETYGREVFQKISYRCQLYLAQHELSKAKTVDALKASAERLYNKCLCIPLECSSLEEKIMTDIILNYHLKVATETYMQHTLNNHVFNAIGTLTSHQDSNFNKITRNLQEIQMKHFEIARYQELISAAKCELKKINHYITTLGKIQCLKATFNILSCPSVNDIQDEVLNADDLLQLFAFLLIKLNVNNWIANLTYMKEFMFSHADTHDESDYLITTLEAAIDFIKGASLFEKLNSDMDNQQITIVICGGNLEELKELFAKEAAPLDTKPDDQSLCHPLCSCDQCEAILSRSRTTRQTCADYVDEKGRNCLHIACMHGYPQTVDFLLFKGIPCNVADYSGSFPIHYTALRGHLNPLLLLLHLGADINATNADGNTALHLAANNGHENCVKGLLYFSEHQSHILNVNRCNAWGETALHLASKWGYMNIVNILLEYDVDVRIRNKRNETALNVAHSAGIRKLISAFLYANEDFVFVEANGGGQKEIREARDFSCDAEDVKAYGVRPKNFEQFKRADLLLKAIENNDLPLSCFYLGIPLSPNVNNNNNNGSLTASDELISKECKHSLSSISTFHCHPLCDCPLCATTKSKSITSHPQSTKLNVNICNSEGFTPLHVAAQFGRNEILRLLLDAGADCNLQTYKAFYSPLHLACINQRVHALKELLLSGSCNLDLQDGKGNTALHYACRKNDLRILDILLSNGADSSIKNNSGMTVLRLAQEKSLFAVVKIIKEKSRDIHSSYEDLL